MARVWIYAFGEVGGEDIKFGHSGDQLLSRRLATVNRTQTTQATYRILAGVAGTGEDEKAIKRYFAQWNRPDKGTHKEYFWPSDEVIEYVNWLRSQWWVTHDSSIALDKMPFEDPSHWLPTEGRRISHPPIDPELLVQPYEDLEGALAGTAWNWLVSDKAQIQDYFTPPELVDAARLAMGGIDLDAASHWIANQKFRIPDYFHRGRDAMENDWYGKVWLNPPYNKNAPWFERILKFIASGDIEQICMLSPMYVFQTRQAQEVMELSSALVLLTPTPKFWGNSEGREGTNLPHGIVYIGDRTAEFREAFRPFGFTVKVDWDGVLDATYLRDR